MKIPKLGITEGTYLHQSHLLEHRCMVDKNNHRSLLTASFTEHITKISNLVYLYFIVFIVSLYYFIVLYLKYDYPSSNILNMSHRLRVSLVRISSIKQPKDSITTSTVYSRADNKCKQSQIHDGRRHSVQLLLSVRTSCFVEFLLVIDND